MKKIIILGLIFLFLVTGCQQNNLYEPKKVEYHTGIEGIVIDTAKDMPPDIVFEKSEFIVGVELKNKGAYDVSDGTIAIVGLDPKYMRIEKDQELFSLSGKNPQNPEGGYDIKNFKLKNVWFPTGKEEQRIPFTIIADYDYETKGTVQVCINPNLYSYIKTKETGCEIKDLSISEGQGAPVAITKVDPAISLLSNDFNQLDVRFGIHIENKGDGLIVGDISVEDAVLGTTPIKCSETRKENLEDEETRQWYISCSTEMVKPGQAYLSPLTLTLKYRYRERLNKEVSIKTTVV
jgi:hypothetical protein